MYNIEKYLSENKSKITHICTRVSFIIFLIISIASVWLTIIIRNAYSEVFSSFGTDLPICAKISISLLFPFIVTAITIIGCIFNFWIKDKVLCITLYNLFIFIEILIAVCIASCYFFLPSFHFA